MIPSRPGHLAIFLLSLGLEYKVEKDSRAGKVRPGSQYTHESGGRERKSEGGREGGRERAKGRREEAGGGCETLYPHI